MQQQSLWIAGFLAIATSAAAVAVLRPFAQRVGWVDCPDHRKCHQGRVPLVGGVSFFLGLLAAQTYMGWDRFTVSLMWFGAGLLLVGVIDDREGLGVRTRLAVQAIAALGIMAAMGMYIDQVALLVGPAGGVVLGVPLTMLAMMGVVNAFNLMDGVDGLAGCLGLVALGSVAIVAGPAAMPFLLLLGCALVPYLSANLGWWPGGKVFMGDAGSTLLGFLIASALVMGCSGAHAAFRPVDALWFVAVPLFDTAAVIIRRLRTGASPFQPDRNHVHHLLQDNGCAPRTTLLLVAGAGLGLSLLGMGLSRLPGVVSMVAFAAVGVSYLLGFDALLAMVCRRRAQRMPAPFPPRRVLDLTVPQALPAPPILTQVAAPQERDLERRVAS